MLVEGDGDIRYVLDWVLKGLSICILDGVGGLFFLGFDKSYCGESGIMFFGFLEFVIV